VHFGKSLPCAAVALVADPRGRRRRGGKLTVVAKLNRPKLTLRTTVTAKR
jgi:hypothetical protein